MNRKNIGVIAANSVLSTTTLPEIVEEEKTHNFTLQNTYPPLDPIFSKYPNKPERTGLSKKTIKNRKRNKLARKARRV